MTDSGGSTPAWYALQLRPNREFRVRDALAELGVEAFLPTRREKRRWSDRAVDAERCLLPGYIFARVAHDHIFPRSEPGNAVSGVVMMLGPIPANEIENFRRALDAAGRVPVLPCAYVAGETVTVARGPFAGVQGIVTRTRGSHRLTVRVEALKRAVSVEIDAKDLEKL